MLSHAGKEKLINTNFRTQKPMTNHPHRKFVSLLFVALMAGCGGGGSGTPTPTILTPTPTPTPTPVPNSALMTMSCVDGPAYQCSGGNIIKSDNGVALTSSGVQAYGKSTSDLVDPNPNGGGAFGLP